MLRTLSRYRALVPAIALVFSLASSCSAPPTPGPDGGDGSTGGGTATGGGGGSMTIDAGFDAGVIICTPGTPMFCQTPTTLRTCSSTGMSWLDSPCTNGRACVADAGVNAACQCIRRLTACFNFDVYEFDTCGNRLGLVEDCLLSNEELCRTFAGSAATTSATGRNAGQLAIDLDDEAEDARQLK